MNEKVIRYETPNFWVKDVGVRGFEVYKTGLVVSTRVACIGHGPAPRLGLTRAIAECDRRQKELDAGVHA